MGQEKNSVFENAEEGMLKIKLREAVLQVRKIDIDIA